jgi:lipid-A-disaccharide synthase
VLLESARLLKERFPDLQFILPLASSLGMADISPFIAGSGLEITVEEGLGYDVMQVCDAIITVSGTVTLEIALIGVPMVIIYRVSPLTYEIGKRLIRVAHIGICNIVAGERVVPELIQDDAEPARIAAEVERMLTDPPYGEAIRTKLLAVREKLGSGGGSAKAARLVLEMVNR